MKSIDELMADKIYEMVNYLLAKKIKPDITLDRVTSLTQEDIRKMKEKLGIQGVILDVDETLRKNMKSIPNCNQQWIEMLKKELKVIVVSNGIDKSAENFFKLQGIDYIGFAHKPLKRNFVKACERMQISPDRVLVIGDSLFNDIWGGKRNNMKTALVQGVDDGR